MKEKKKESYKEYVYRKLLADDEFKRLNVEDRARFELIINEEFAKKQSVFMFIHNVNRRWQGKSPREFSLWRFFHVNDQLKERIITEARFFVFEEKEPVRGIIKSPLKVIALLCSYLVIIWVLSYWGFLIWTGSGFLYSLGYLGLVALVVFEIAHYATERPSPEDTPEHTKKREYSKKSESGREATESQLGR
jgi:hypothetical protein